MEHHPMYMKDWVAELDDFSARYGKGVLENAGTISHTEAIEKAEAEYKKYKQKTVTDLSAVERDFLENVIQAQKKLEKKTRTE
jgi:hypothetical protein